MLRHSYFPLNSWDITCWMAKLKRYALCFYQSEEIKIFNNLCSWLEIKSTTIAFTVTHYSLHLKYTNSGDINNIIKENYQPWYHIMISYFKEIQEGTFRSTILCKPIWIDTQKQVNLLTTKPLRRLDIYHIVHYTRKPLIYL